MASCGKMDERLTLGSLGAPLPALSPRSPCEMNQKGTVMLLLQVNTLLSSLPPRTRAHGEKEEEA